MAVETLATAAVALCYRCASHARAFLNHYAKPIYSTLKDFRACIAYARAFSVYRAYTIRYVLGYNTEYVWSGLRCTEQYK